MRTEQPLLNVCCDHFRCSPMNRHRQHRSACLKSANNGHSDPKFADTLLLKAHPKGPQT